VELAPSKAKITRSFYFLKGHTQPNKGRNLKKLSKTMENNIKLVPEPV